MHVEISSTHVESAAPGYLKYEATAVKVGFQFQLCTATTRWAVQVASIKTRVESAYVLSA